MLGGFKNGIHGKMAKRCETGRQRVKIARIPNQRSSQQRKRKVKEERAQDTADEHEVRWERSSEVRRAVAAING